MHTDSPYLGQGYCQVIENVKFSYIKEFQLVVSSIYTHNSNKYADGKLSGGINQEGVKFYNNLINELLANGNT